MGRNEDKVSYLLKLVGRKRPAVVSTNDSDSESENHSDYEDMIETSTIAQKVKLLEQIPKGDYGFHPSISIVQDEYQSETTASQDTVEETILNTYKSNPIPDFDLESHKKFITRCLKAQMPAGYSVLDANHPWMTYWLYNAYSLLSFGDPFDASVLKLMDDKISRCIINNGLGGIAGGANQLGHAAATYAAILSLVSTKSYQLLNEIKPNLYKWFLSLKTSQGGFRMHQNGESDTRSTYCVLTVCSLLNILTPEIVEGTLEWLNSCQTYEGGFAGIPNTEAHGGYTFCAVASYFLLFKDVSDFYSEKSFDLQSLIRWSVQRQYQLEGALSGRTNKLVDACYSFWIGGVFPLLESISDGPDELFNRDGLRNYILRCAQSETGGFRDKPGKSVDFYHTNYTLCGLSICEHLLGLEEDDQEFALAYRFYLRLNTQTHTHTRPVHPVFGLPIDTVEEAKKRFYS